jgi:hypothetical protein
MTPAETRAALDAELKHVDGPCGHGRPVDHAASAIRLLLGIVSDNARDEQAWMLNLDRRLGGVVDRLFAVEKTIGLAPAEPSTSPAEGDDEWWERMRKAGVQQAHNGPRAFEDWLRAVIDAPTPPVAHGLDGDDRVAAMTEVLDIVERPGITPIGAPGSVMRRAWELGTRHAHYAESIVRALADALREESWPYSTKTLLGLLGNIQNGRQKQVTT